MQELRFPVLLSQVRWFLALCRVRLSPVRWSLVPCTVRLSLVRWSLALYTVRLSLARKSPAPCRVRPFREHWFLVLCKVRPSREHWFPAPYRKRQFPERWALCKSYPARCTFRQSQRCCCRIPYRNLRNLYYLKNRCPRCHSRSYHRKHRNCCPSFHPRRYLYCNPDFRPLSKCLYFPRNNRCHSYRCSPYSRHFRFRQPLLLLIRAITSAPKVSG